jgi:hypothetical protein
MSLPRTHDELIDDGVRKNGQIVRLLGALRELFDAVDAGGPVPQATLDRARAALRMEPPTDDPDPTQLDR